jgi:4-hydroxy-tetrahydrodipicolinate synthase
VSEPYILRTYLAPERDSGNQAEAAALTVLAELLGGSGQTSVLPRALQFDSQTAVYSAAFYDGSSIDDATFGVIVVPSPGVSLATAERALQNPRIIGIKDSSADMIQVHGLLQLASQRPDWSVFVGHEQLTAEAVLLGAHGGINAGANLLPAFYSSLYNAAAAGDLATVRALQPKAVQIASLLYSVGPPATSLVRGVKGTLALLGICSDLMAEPLQAFSDPERAELRRRMLLCGITPALP